MKKEMRRERCGEVRLETEKVYTLAYADDVALIAENKKGMRGLMVRIERYVEEKSLKINTSKTKIMR